MAWTEITRPKYRRDGLRYASNTTDEEWALIEPLLPAPTERGRPRETAMRKVVNAIFYIAQSGCHWRMRGGTSRLSPGFSITSTAGGTMARGAASTTLW